MPRIDPEGQLTRAERLVVVLAVAAALVVHLAVLFGWGRLTRLALEAEKKERLVVIRRVRDLAPPPEPEPPRPREVVTRPEGAAGGTPSPPPPPPKPQVKEPGEPPKEQELSRRMEEDLREEKPEEGAPPPEEGENTVSVVTDLRQASFTVSGPAEFRGSGTLWLRKGAPPGTYTATFHAVAGYATPAIQAKELVARGQIVFVGKYRKSVEVIVQTSEPGAGFTVYRPDGQPLQVGSSGRAFLDDLPPGTYTAVFKDVPGHITPAPVTRTLSAGAGSLSFFGDYRDARGVGAGGAGQGAGSGAGAGSGLGSAGSGEGAARPRRPPPPPAAKPAPSAGPGLDRRVQIIVKSYPPTDVEEDFDPIAYPEVIIQRSNFQRGWCQVYLIVAVDDRGEVKGIEVQRPGRDERAQYAALIEAVERAVRGWDYDKVAAEVHVDARFYVE